jgi:Ca2+-binding EF-hand superfamily protein
LKPYLRKNGYLAYDEDLVAFIRRLDKDGDAQLSYVEFIEGIIPVEKPPPKYETSTFNYSYPDLPSHLYIRHDDYRPISPLKKGKRGKRSKTSDQVRKTRSSPIKRPKSVERKTRMVTKSKSAESPFKSPSKSKKQKKVPEPLKRESRQTEHEKTRQAETETSKSARTSPLKKEKERLPHSEKNKEKAERVKNSKKREEKKEQVSKKEEEKEEESEYKTPEKEAHTPSFSEERKSGKKEILKGILKEAKEAESQKLHTQSSSPSAYLKQRDQTEYTITNTQKQHQHQHVRINPSQQIIGALNYSYDQSNPQHRFKTHNQTNPDLKLFINALRKQIQLHNLIETLKQDLALKSDFNLLDAFRIIDSNAKGFVTSGELLHGFRLLSVFPEKDALLLFFRRYDRDSDGKFKYSDFCDAFTPKQIEYAQLLNNRAPYNLHHIYVKDKYFAPETLALYKKCLLTHLHIEKEAEEIRQALHKRPFFNVHKAFQICDINNRNSIVLDEVSLILNKFNLI